MTEFPLNSTLIGVAWLVVIAAAVSALVAAISAQRGAGNHTLVSRVVTVWLGASLLAVVVLTLQPGPEGLGSARPSVFDPIARLDREDAVANALLYLPVGLFAALLWRSHRWVIVWATAFAFCVSFSIELAQWLLPIDRAATTHDVIFNTLGAFVGAIVGTLLARLVAAAIGVATQKQEPPASAHPKR